jgi:hypothetical protein
MWPLGLLFSKSQKFTVGGSIIQLIKKCSPYIQILDLLNTTILSYVNISRLLVDTTLHSGWQSYVTLCGSSEARKRPTSRINMKIAICIHILVMEIIFCRVTAQFCTMTTIQNVALQLGCLYSQQIMNCEL